MQKYYEKRSFEGVGTELADLPMERYSQQKIIEHHLAEIESARASGISDEQIYEVFKNRGLNIKLSTFRTSISKARKEKLRMERKAKRLAKAKAKTNGHVEVRGNGRRNSPKPVRADP